MATPGVRVDEAIPAQLTPQDRNIWRQAFLDLDNGRTDPARQLLATATDHILAATLQARLWQRVAPGPADAEALRQWLLRHGAHPDAARVAAWARQLGMIELPMIAQPRPLRYRASTTGRAPVDRPRKADASDRNGAHIEALLAADKIDAAQESWRKAGDRLSPSLRANLAQNIAWRHYLAGNDPAAIAMGESAGLTQEESAARGYWIAGLAAWRSDDCNRAAAAFDQAARIATDFGRNERAASARFWASRAHLACGRPEMSAPRLQAAATQGESFYGLLAQRALGLPLTQDWQTPGYIRADWNTLSSQLGAQRASALVEIGQLGLADNELRHLAALGTAAEYEAVLRLAARLNLPATQYWLAHHPPQGVKSPMAARYPAPSWTPARGWRIDNALVFAHALQESRFMTDAVSRAGARGVMQLMPQTAAHLQRGRPADETQSLADPAFNIELGQAYLEQLRDSGITEGLLPKVIAAYNAGPGSVKKWNSTLRDKGDPLLFIESIPFRETRHYVETVLRNYWMYQMRNGQKPASLDAMAMGLWPRFPGLPGVLAVRRDSSGSVASAD